MSTTKNNAFWGYYALLVLVRITISAFLKGYIHPDEHFQSPEIAAGWLYRNDTLTPWEYRPPYYRSTIPLFLTSLLPFWLLGLVVDQPSPWLLFHVSRSWMTLLSFATDYLVHDLGGEHALLLFASSYVTHTYLVRPFSNSLELFVVLLCVWLYTKKYSFILGCMAGVSIFIRITAPAFIIPLGILLVFRQFAMSRVIVAGVGVLISTVACVAVDSVILGESLHSWVLAPWNNIRYNSLSSNLASHGLHPRWLHLVVNVPLLLGPLSIVVAWRFLRSRMIDWRTENVLPASCAASGLAFLSAFPHQEPRFIIPMIPMLLISAKKRLNQLTWVSWIMFNAILTIFYGYIHQGGLVPMSLKLSVHDTEIITNNVFMAPRYLISGQDNQVRDLGSISPQFYLYRDCLVDLGDHSTGVNPWSLSTRSVASPIFCPDRILLTPDQHKDLEYVDEQWGHLNVDHFDPSLILYAYHLRV